MRTTRNRSKTPNIFFFYLVACVFLAAGIFLAGCGKKEVAEGPEPVRPVKTIVVGGLGSGVLTYPGTVEAGEKAALSFRVSGRLTNLNVDEGQAVKKGQVIAQLDPKDYQIALQEAKAENVKAVSDYNRYQDLFARNAVSLADLELRRSQRDVTAARLEQAEKNLDYTTLRAPFDGIIGRKYVQNFMDVKAQQEIVDLNDVNNVEIKFDVPESILKQIQGEIKAKVFARFPTTPGKEYPLEFKEIGARADPTTRTFEVTFLMPNPEEVTLLPGMTGEVVIKLSVSDEGLAAALSRITIPAIAVMGDAEGDGFVWIVDKETMTVHKQPVELGPLSGDSGIRIVAGLEGGETVVVAGLTSLREGQKVWLWGSKES